MQTIVGTLAYCQESHLIDKFENYHLLSDSQGYPVHVLKRSRRRVFFRIFLSFSFEVVRGFPGPLVSAITLAVVCGSTIDKGISKRLVKDN